MAEPIVSFFLQKSGEQLRQQAQLLSGVTEDVEWIHGELQFLRPFLKDADRRREREESVEGWVQQVRKLVFDSEDAIDEFVVRTQMNPRRLSEGNLGLLAFHAWGFIFHHQFNTRFLRIRREVKEIRERSELNQFQATIDAGDVGVVDSYFNGEVDLVGRENDLKLLEEWLLKEEKQQQRSVISLAGKGGLGKTTLAKKVFQLMERHFECYAWVFVTKNVDIRDHLLGILKAFYKSREEKSFEGMEAMNKDELGATILNYLQGKRYGLVLDDIREASVWVRLNSAFPLNNGRIIFTTRDENLTLPLHQVVHVHKLNPLPDTVALELFYKKAFHLRSCPQHLNGLAEALVKRCNGSPLAVLAMGGLMSRKGIDPMKWKSVLDDLDCKPSYKKDPEQVNEILVTSYNYLPPHLKYCFLYCAMFPKGYEITKNTIIKLWVAEGFVEEHPKKTPENLAGDYFVELVDRSLLEPVIYYYDSNLRRCKMHNLAHDFAIHMLEKEYFGVVISTAQNTKLGRWVRRIGIHNNEMGTPPTIDKWYLRSFLMSGIHGFPSSLNQVIFGPKLLRVLNLEDVAIESLPEEVCDLIHLRYLSLFKSGIKTLPSSVGKLQNLLSLSAEKTKVTSLPAGIVLLQQLRYLVVGDYAKRVVLVPSGVKNLRNLQILFGVMLDPISIAELGSLTQLTKLDMGEVRGGEYLTQLCYFIRQMKQLRHLAIRMSAINDDARNQNHHQLEMLMPPPYLEDLYFNGHLEELPRWVASLNSLHMVQLVGAKSVKDPLNIFASLPNLEYLGLEDAYMGKQMGCSAGAFPKLRFLDIARMEELEEWRQIEEGSFQRLEYLTIGECKKLKKLPRGFQHLKALQRLLLVEMAEEFVSRLDREGGENHWMPQRIPRIVVSQKYDEKTRLFSS